MLCVIGFMLLFTVAAATAADAPKLTFHFKPANVPGAVHTEPAGINNQGEMVGTYYDSSGGYHGYILKGKNWTPLNDPNGTNTSAQGINYNGAILVAGYYLNSVGADVGFLYSAKTGTFTDIKGPTGAVAAQALGVNDKGEIVGAYWDSAGNEDGFLLRGKTYTILHIPGYAATSAIGINNKGDIVLQWIQSGVSGASLTTNTGKTYTNIDVPRTERAGSNPNGINNADDVTFGWYSQKGLRSALCIKCNAGGRKYYKFTYPKGAQSFAAAPNDKHAFPGAYIATGGWSGYLATYK
jgi:uncharacterized membrane protein